MSLASIRKGWELMITQVDLPTLLKGRHLSIDIARWGRFINMKINAFFRVAVQDGIAKDGVIHVLNTVLIPPKKLGDEAWHGEELDLDDFKERLEPFVDEKPEL
jgi:hypothetical protein